MKFPLFHVDAFADGPFSGNPAAVAVLAEWLPDGVLQAIAAETNLSETAFIVMEQGQWRIRWFTPSIEVELCGHATLAAGWVMLTKLSPEADQVVFNSLSGPLTVTRANDGMVVDLPANPPRSAIFPAEIERVVGAPVREVLATKDHYVAMVDTAEIVSRLTPDPRAVLGLDRWALIVTAPGTGEIDFVSRFFAPRKGLGEDPVTGSAHCVLAPLWSKRLGKPHMVARQLSPRGGLLKVHDKGDRIALQGRVVGFSEGVAEI